jgi:hypothetical protein
VMDCIKLVFKILCLVVFMFVSCFDSANNQIKYEVFLNFKKPLTASFFIDEGLSKHDSTAFKVSWGVNKLKYFKDFIRELRIEFYEYDRWGNSPLNSCNDSEKASIKDSFKYGDIDKEEMNNIEYRKIERNNIEGCYTSIQKKALFFGAATINVKNFNVATVLYLKSINPDDKLLFNLIVESIDFHESK